MAGIAGALGLAISCISQQRRDFPSQTQLQKVIVLTDCQAALSELQKLRNYNKSKEQIRHYALGRKLITRSQYLEQLRISLEIHWMPRRQQSLPGSILADAGARRAWKATSRILEEEAVQVILPPLARSDY